MERAELEGAVRVVRVERAELEGAVRVVRVERAEFERAELTDPFFLVWFGIPIKR